MSSTRVGVPVISVGNLTAGGSGKTPTVLWLTERLARDGWRVGLVSRGYRGVRRHDPLVVGREGRILVPAVESGDEAALLASDAPAHVVVVGRARVAAAELAVQSGADVIVVDDGFQHRRLARDLDIVLVDAAQPFDNGRGLPAGLLREPPGGLVRAGLILLTRAGDAALAVRGFLPDAALPPALSAVLDALPAAPPVAAAAHAVQRLVLPGGAAREPRELAGQRVLAVSGIAQPASFEDSLVQCGAVLAAHLAFPDHHRFNAGDAADIAQRAQELGPVLIVTTAKDRLRWPAGAPEPAVLLITLRVPAEDAVLAWVRARIGR